MTSLTAIRTRDIPEQSQSDPVRARAPGGASETAHASRRPPAPPGSGQEHPATSEPIAVDRSGLVFAGFTIFVQAGMLWMMTYPV